MEHLFNLMLVLGDAPSINPLVNGLIKRLVLRLVLLYWYWLC